MDRRRFLLAAGGLALGGCSTPGIELDVPYVSTPHAVVDAMLELARVGPTDVVYDLGCGDGRFVIAAAAEFGARGVGVDIDPARIAEANAAAEREGVAGRVRFVRGNLFDVDLSPATVVTLFLLPELNDRLAPKLRRELRAGARIVSHRWTIRGWPADETIVVDVGEVRHEAFLWVNRKGA
ncbi:MAG: class I SAM-dependent methyltransferase [Burkholderiales bacterium]|nr:class I SAM-dependent methyltransferase [Burkholderiales bacterium]